MGNPQSVIDAPEVNMRIVIVLLTLVTGVFSQVSHSSPTAAPELKIEVRASSTRVRIGDDIVVTVLFRSPSRDITLWNFLAWGASAGLYLKVFDASGREVQNHFAPFGEPAPPDLTGKDALLSIAGNVFAGFDDRIAVESLFLRPGRYRIKCLYIPPLSRDYFQGHTIWGKEDGPVESAELPILVE
jgi:hypothetical protein